MELVSRENARRAKAREWARRWRLKNPDKVKAANARFRAKHREAHLARKRAWHWANRPALLERMRLRSKLWEANTPPMTKRARRYKLSEEKIQTLLAAGCEVCGSKKGLEIDHDHKCCEKGSCGRCVRGMLCRQCNRGIGMADDSPERLRAMAAYLERFLKTRAIA